MNGLPRLFHSSSSGPDTERKRRASKGYILVEVLVAMTVFAIAGTVLIRSLMNAFEATRTLRDITKAVYMTKVMLNDLELRYTRRVDVQLGRFEGNYPYPGTQKFHWTANIEYDRKMDAYVITVHTTWEENEGSRRRRGRWRSEESGGITLKSMVMTARYNEQLVLGFGATPEIGRRNGGAGRQRGGGSRRR